MVTTTPPREARGHPLMTLPLTTIPLYQALSSALAWARNAPPTWTATAYAQLDSLQADHLPHGSGLDGTHHPLDRNASTPERLVFNLDYHFMDDSGMYAGWYSYILTVKASLQNGITLRTTGRETPGGGTRDYLSELFDQALRTPVPRNLT